MLKPICPFCGISNATTIEDDLYKCESCGKAFAWKKKKEKTDDKKDSDSSSSDSVG